MIMEEDNNKPYCKEVKMATHVIDEIKRETGEEDPEVIDEMLNFYAFINKDKIIVLDDRNAPEQ